MRAAVGVIILPLAVAVLTVLALPALGWTADTGAAVLTAGVDAGAASVGTVDQWLHFTEGHLSSIFSILGIGIVGGFGLALLIRAQLKLWRADATGNALTSAVTMAGVEGLVKPIMDNAPAPIKAKAWEYARKRFQFLK
jgi:hypothetical protein